MEHHFFFVSCLLEDLLKKNNTGEIQFNIKHSFFSLQKVSKAVEEHAGHIEKLEIGVAGTKVVLKKVIRDVKQQGKEIEGVKVELGEVNTRVDRVEVDVKDTKEKVEELDKKVQNKIEYLYILTPPFLK